MRKIFIVCQLDNVLFGLVHCSKLAIFLYGRKEKKNEQTFFKDCRA